MKLRAATITNRSDPVRGADGVERTSLSVTTSFTTEGHAGVGSKGAKLEFGLSHGHSVTYRVTVDSTKADEIENGTARLPNPYNPLTLNDGEGIELTKWEFHGSSIEGSIGAVSVGVERQISKGKSAAVQRVNTKTVRVILGDKEAVTNALSLGVGNAALGVAISTSTTTEHARLTYVDLDISTRAGWNAYERFVAEGRLPRVYKRDQPGVVDAATGGSTTWSSGVTASVTVLATTISIGGTHVDGATTWFRHPDGSKDSTFMSVTGDITMNISHTIEPDGSKGPSRYWLDLNDVSSDYLDYYPPDGHTHAGGDADARLSFTLGGLRTLRHNVLRAISQQLVNSHDDDPLKPRQVAQYVLKHGHLPLSPALVPGISEGIAAAQSPGAILRTLAQATAGNPAALLEELVFAQSVDGLGRDEVTFPGKLTVYTDGE